MSHADPFGPEAHSTHCPHHSGKHGHYCFEFDELWICEDCSECHRSQLGENHKAIKEFFPKAQLFGFTGTPIFEANASLQKIDGQQASLVTTKDLFQKQFHAHTIEDQKVSSNLGVSADLDQPMKRTVAFCELRNLGRCPNYSRDISHFAFSN